MGGEATGRRARAHQGAKQVARAAGDGKRRRVFTPPLPPNWQRTEAGGYQEYKLPPGSRVYQWRSFTYTDEYKKGEEKTVAPGAVRRHSVIAVFVVGQHTSHRHYQCRYAHGPPSQAPRMGSPAAPKVPAK